MRQLVVLLVLAVSSTGTGRLQAAPTRPSTPPITPWLLDDLARIATGEPLDSRTRADELARLRSGAETLEHFVDRLLERPGFAHKIAPLVIVASEAIRFGAGTLPFWVLRSFTPKGSDRPIYFLRQPCDPAQAEPVHPWWDMKSTVRVCPDSHRPKVLGDPAKGWACGSWNLAPYLSPLCGCGPNLVTCQRDRAQFTSFVESTVAEVPRTTAYVVEHDQPIANVYTSNESFHDPYNDYYYNRWRVLNGELKEFPDLGPLDAPGSYSARHETVAGEHAGILTTPNMLFTADAPRPRLNLYFHQLWCTKVESVSVKTEQVLALNASSTRDGEGWEQLTTMPFCTNCHARLDYGVRFFSGWRDNRAASFFEPNLQLTGMGKVYNRNINDLLGEAELTPRGFAEFAVKQPQFGDCKTENVLHYVFNDNADEEDFRAVRASFTETGRLKPMMRVALLRYAQRHSSPVAGPRLSVPGAPASASVLSLPASLQKKLAARCVTCHDDGAQSFSQARLPRPLLQEMLTFVAFGKMPRGKPLSEPERVGFVADLVSLLWRGPKERQAALAYFTDGQRASSIHHPFSVFAGMRSELAQPATESSAGVPAGLTTSPDSMLNIVEPYMDQETVQFTPGFAASVTLQALKACKAAGKTARALDECVLRTSRVQAAVKTIH